MAEVGVLGLRQALHASADKRVALRPDAAELVVFGRGDEVVADLVKPAEPAEKAEGARADVPEERESVQETADKIRDSLNRNSMDLNIVVDDGYYVFELVDRRSGEVVRRIPPNWFKTTDPYSTRPQGKDGMPPGVFVDQNG